MIETIYFNPKTNEKEKVWILGFVAKDKDTFAIFTRGQYRLEEDYIGRFVVPIKE